jgi:hypothetical protein
MAPVELRGLPPAYVLVMVVQALIRPGITGHHLADTTGRFRGTIRFRIVGCRLTMPYCRVCGRVGSAHVDEVVQGGCPISRSSDSTHNARVSLPHTQPTHSDTPRPMTHSDSSGPRKPSSSVNSRRTSS